MSAPNFYDVLGVSRNATEAEIKAAFRRKAKHAHPDKGGTDEQMSAINRAYECLIDIERRAIYDERGTDEAASPVAERVRSILMDAFQFFIFQAPESAGIEACEMFIQQRINAIDAEKATAMNARKKCAKRRSKITKKTGDNLFHMLIDDQLSKINEALARMEAQLNLEREALKMLREYESIEDIIEPRTATEALLQRRSFYLPSGY